MSAAGFLLAFASAACWGGLDATRKHLTTQVRPLPLVFWLTLGQLPLFGLWTLSAGGAPAQLWGYVPPAIAAVGFNIAANLMFLRGLQVAPLSTSVPLLALTPVFSALMALALLGEWPLPRDWAGIAVVVVGMTTLGRISSLWAAVRRQDADGVAQGMLWMAGTALCWSCTGALDKVALQHAGVPFHALVQAAGVTLSTAVVLGATGRWAAVGDLRQVAGTYLAAIVFASAALGLQFLAFGVSLVSLVEAVKRAVGMSLAVVNGRAFFAEPLTARKLTSVGLMLVGVLLLVVP